MPHLIFEYTANLKCLDVRKSLKALNTALMDGGHFEGPDIKSQAIRMDDFLVGNGVEAGAFALREQLHALRVFARRAASFKVSLVFA